MTLTNIPLFEAARYVSGLAGLRMHAKDDSVWFFPASRIAVAPITRELYFMRTPPWVTREIDIRSSRVDVKPWFIEHGVQFGEGEEAWYIPRSEKLVVHIVPEQLDLVELIFSSCCGRGPASSRWERTKWRAHSHWYSISQTLFPAPTPQTVGSTPLPPPSDSNSGAGDVIVSPSPTEELRIPGL